jgi:hypothetical protein
MAAGVLFIGTLASKGRFNMNTSKKIWTSILGLLILVAVVYQVSARFADTSPIPAVTAPVAVELNLGEHTALGAEVASELVAIEAIEAIEEAEAEAEAAEVAEVAEEADHHRYALVEHSVQSVTEDSRTVPGSRSTWRRHLVNDRGEWFEIPDSELEWAAAVTEGTVVELPRTVLAWVPVEQSAVLMHGSGTIDALSGEYRSFSGNGVRGHDEGIYFFVAVK